MGVPSLERHETIPGGLHPARNLGEDSIQTRFDGAPAAAMPCRAGGFRVNRVRAYRPTQGLEVILAAHPLELRLRELEALFDTEAQCLVAMTGPREELAERADVPRPKV